MYQKLRRHVSMPGLLSTVGKVFSTVPDPVVNRGFTLRDCLMSGLAVYHLKSPSLLDFDQKTGAKMLTRRLCLTLKPWDAG